MIGERLQEIRKDKNMTQQQLADIVDVSFHTISSYERDRSEPNDEIKIRIAQTLDISLDYLLGLIDESHSYKAGHYTYEIPSTLSKEAAAIVKKDAEFLAEQLSKKII